MINDDLIEGIGITGCERCQLQELHLTSAKLNSLDELLRSATDGKDLGCHEVSFLVGIYVAIGQNLIFHVCRQNIHHQFPAEGFQMLIFMPHQLQQIRNVVVVNLPTFQNFFNFLIVFQQLISQLFILNCFQVLQKNSYEEFWHICVFSAPFFNIFFMENMLELFKCLHPYIFDIIKLWIWVALVDLLGFINRTIMN